MRYLKVFEGAGVLEQEELRDFCEQYLAYLVDDGLKINVKKEVFFIKTLAIILTIEGRTLSWFEIKDHFLTFLDILQKKYTIGVYPYQKCNYHKSWLDKKVTFSVFGKDPINIDIDKIESISLDKIYKITIIVHTK